MSNVQLITGQIAKASLQATKKGKFVLAFLPTGDIARINPTGRFLFTEKELTVLANNVGLNSYEALLTVLSEGGCNATLKATFCKEGEAHPYREGELNNKDWYDVDNIVTTFDFSVAADTFRRDLIKSNLINREANSAKEARNEARKARLDAMLMLMNDGVTVDNSSTDSSNGIEDEDPLADSEE